MITNSTNQGHWPQVVSDDVVKNMGGFKGDVYKFSGQVKGRTLLPLPSQADSVVRAADRHDRYACSYMLPYMLYIHVAVT